MSLTVVIAGCSSGFGKQLSNAAVEPFHAGVLAAFGMTEFTTLRPLVG